MPVVPALPVVTAACFFLLQAGHGCGLHPAFPAPSDVEGETQGKARADPAARTPRYILFTAASLFDMLIAHACWEAGVARMSASDIRE